MKYSFKELIKMIQKAVSAKADGVFGAQTATKIALRLGLIKYGQKPKSTKFPRERDAEAFFGKPNQNHTLMTLPYPMRLSWDLSTTVTRITVNKKCAKSLKRILQRALDHYGIEKIKELGLDVYGGCFNDRPKRGGRNKSCTLTRRLWTSTQRETACWNRTRARLGKMDLQKFFEIVEDEGWTSLGRERDFDWMHIQAPRL